MDSSKIHEIVTQFFERKYNLKLGGISQPAFIEDPYETREQIVFTDTSKNTIVVKAELSDEDSFGGKLKLIEFELLAQYPEYLL